MFLIIWSFIFGSSIGSFLLLSAKRIPIKHSLLYPSSHCESCQHNLAWYDLIPVLSWIYLGGKCRYCKQTISWFMPLFEITIGLLFTALVHEQISLIQFWLLLMGLTLSVMDWDTLTIYPEILYSFTIILFLQNVFFHIPYYFFTAICFYLFLSLLSFLTDGALGGGDIKLLTIWSFFLGPETTIYLVFIGSISAAIVILLYAKSNYKILKQPIPFVPFLTYALFVISSASSF